jgi:hypothetical protein
VTVTRYGVREALPTFETVTVGNGKNVENRVQQMTEGEDHPEIEIDTPYHLGTVVTRDTTPFENALKLDVNITITDYLITNQPESVTTTEAGANTETLITLGRPTCWEIVTSAMNCVVVTPTGDTSTMRRKKD